jgi:L-methionine (R)-S-oxide reductase
MLVPEPIVKKLHGAFCRGVTRQELLELAASQIRAAGPPYTSVYLYMLDDSDRMLRLEAYDGRDTEHTSIPIGHGLCGKAVADRVDLNVGDVTTAPEYLACSLDTRSELIVLIRRHDKILGQIDIDSDVPDGFDEREQDAVRQVADALASLL